MELATQLLNSLINIFTLFCSLTFFVERLQVRRLRAKSKKRVWTIVEQLIHSRNDQDLDAVYKQLRDLLFEVDDINARLIMFLLFELESKTLTVTRLKTIVETYKHKQ